MPDITMRLVFIVKLKFVTKFKMKTFSKTDYEKLLEVLVDKRLSFGCKVEWSYEHHLNSRSTTTMTKTGYVVEKYGEVFIKFNGNKSIKKMDEDSIKILGHPILIGDVLEKSEKKDGKWMLPRNIILLWGEIGYQKSLQEIVEKAGWEIIISCVKCKREWLENMFYCPCSSSDFAEMEVLKDPDTAALLSFLKNIFIT